MYNCFDIAKEFLLFAEKENKSIDTMKLLKLTYIAHGWYLGFYGKPLFSNEVQAWKYGPVIPDLYYVIKRYGTGAVNIDIVSLYAEHTVNKQDSDFLRDIWNTYKDKSGVELSARTHRENTPWYQVHKMDTKNTVIDNAVIKGYYKGKIHSTNISNPTTNP